MRPVISIVGKSGVGKTTLIEKLIVEFLKRGYRVAAVKHGLHDFEIDREGKDTWRYTKAGAHSVIISTPHKMAMIKELNGEAPLDEICDFYLDDVDIIITEGYKNEKKQKIEVVRKESHKQFLCGNKDRLIAVASDTPLDIDLPVFDINDAQSICEFVIKQVVKKKRTPSGVVLKINDQKVPLNRFVKEMFKQVLVGMISPLKKVNTPKKVELMIDLKETDLDDHGKGL